MRFDDGEIVCRNEDETESERDSIPAAPPPQKFVVGYALTSKKVKSFLQPKLEGLARKRGILFVAIDLNKPLSEQGPFDIVLHKLTGKEWRQILEIGHLSYSFVSPTYEEDCKPETSRRGTVFVARTPLRVCKV